jgi:hypothetical protein
MWSRPPPQPRTPSHLEQGRPPRRLDSPQEAVLVATPATLPAAATRAAGSTEMTPPPPLADITGRLPGRRVGDEPVATVRVVFDHAVAGYHDIG